MEEKVKNKVKVKEISPSEYGVVFAVILSFGVGLFFQNFYAGVFLGFPIGFIAGVLYGNQIRK